MVQLVLKLCSNPKDWKIVELQGQLETRDSVPLNSMHIGRPLLIFLPACGSQNCTIANTSFFAGDLYFNSEGIASLIVGHHLLTGKIVDLEKPFAVLQKKPITCSKVSYSFFIF